MRKDLIRDWLPWIILVGILFSLWLFMTGCAIPHTWVNGYVAGEPAKNKPKFLWRAYYRTDEDFRKALCKKVAWLEGKGYKVTLVKPVYGRDMTQKEVLKYYIIYYKEVKNEKNHKLKHRG